MEKEHRVRQIREQDLPHVLTVEKEVFGATGYPYMAIRQMYDINAPLMYVATQYGNICAYAIAAINPDGGLGWLTTLAVLPAYRRHGMGYDLTVGRLKALHLHGVRETWTTVRPTAESSLRLHRNIGFKEESYRTNYYGPGEDRILLSLNMHDWRSRFILEGGS